MNHIISLLISSRGYLQSLDFLDNILYFQVRVLSIERHRTEVKSEWADDGELNMKCNFRLHSLHRAYSL